MVYTIAVRAQVFLGTAENGKKKMYGVYPFFDGTLPPKKPKMKELPTAAQVIYMVRGTEIELACLPAIWRSLRMSEVCGLQFGDIKGGVLTQQRQASAALAVTSKCLP